MPPGTPARASDPPISFRNVRRLASSPPAQRSACPGNSRPRYARNSGVSASSSRLRQYCDFMDMILLRDRISAVAGLAVGQPPDGDVTLGDPPPALARLVLGGGPAHVEDGGQVGPDVLLGVAMAAQAP